eukprot:m.56653 g.56653  ORF g.56653 m.56653 type:complete len:89 (+) comp13026_c0_seq1:63-329(+)
MSLFDNAAEDDDDPVEVNASQQAWTSDRLMPVVASLCAQAEIHAHDEVVIAGVSVSLVGQRRHLSNRSFCWQCNRFASCLACKAIRTV